MPKKSPLGVLAKVDADFVAEKLAVEVPLKLNTKLNTKRLSRFPMEFQRKKKWKHRPQSSGTVGACVGASALPAPNRAHRGGGCASGMCRRVFSIGQFFPRLHWMTDIRMRVHRFVAQWPHANAHYSSVPAAESGVNDGRAYGCHVGRSRAGRRSGRARNSIRMHRWLDVGNKMTDNGRNDSRLLIPVHGVKLKDMHISL